MEKAPFREKLFLYFFLVPICYYCEQQSLSQGEGLLWDLVRVELLEEE